MHSPRGSFALKHPRICVRLLAVAVVLSTALAGCASNATPQRKAFTSIDNATNAVQAAVRSYKRQCGVGPGEDGPGSCSPFEYNRAEKAYTDFQKRALGAAGEARRTGSTELSIVSEAALLALDIYDSLKRGAP